MPESPIRDLETVALRLEPLRAEHARHLFAELRDPRLYAFIPHEPPESLERLEERFRMLERRNSPDGTELWLNWAVRRKSDGAYVGLMEATVTAEKEASIAYFVFISHQQQGYAREFCECAVQALFDEYGVSTVSATIDTRNTPSLALVESLGFRQTAFQRAADAFKGIIGDEFRCERTAKMLPPRRNPL